MVGFDEVIRILLGDVARGGYQLLDHSRVGRCPVGGHLSGPWAVLEPTPAPARHEETSAPTVNDSVDGPSQRCAQRQREPPRTALSAGMWAADDRRDLIRASDYPTSGTWLVTVKGVTVGSAQPTYSDARAKRWTALINGMSVLGGRAFPSRDKAATQVLLEHEHRQDQATRNGHRRGTR